MIKCPEHLLDAVFVPHVALRRTQLGPAALYAPFYCCPMVTCGWEVPA